MRCKGLVSKRVVVVALWLVAISSQATLLAQANNPLQIAMLRWYPANRTATFTVGGALGFKTPNFAAFDGTHIWVTDSVSNQLYKLDPSDGSLLGRFSADTSFEENSASDVELTAVAPVAQP